MKKAQVPPPVPITQITVIKGKGFVMDINSLISSYAENNNLSTAEVAERIKNIASNDMLYEKSIFDYGEDASLEELTNYITSERGSSDDIEQLESDISLLFDVLDTNSDGTLSDDELSLFERTSGSNKGNVDAFGIWNQLLNVDTSSVSTSSNSSTSADTADTTTSATTEADFSDKAEAREYVRSFVMSDNLKYDTAAEIISALYEDGTISENQAYQLRQAFTTYTDDDQAKIDNMVKYNGMTEKEAIEYLTGKGWISPDDSALYEEFSVSTDTTTDSATGTTETDTTDTNAAEETVISDKEAEVYCQELYKAGEGKKLGTDEDAIVDVLYNSDLSSADIVKIINTYKEQYGTSLVKALDKEFNDSAEKKYGVQDALVNALVEEVQNGSEEALTTLITSIYDATKGMSGTADVFIETLFSKLEELDADGSNTGSEILYQINSNCKSVTGYDLQTLIKDDFSGSTEKKYLSQIDTMLSNATGVVNESKSTDENAETDNSTANNTVTTANTTANTSAVKDFSDTEYAKAFVNTFIDSSDYKYDSAIEVIEYLLSSGEINEEQAEQLKNAFKSYSDSDERQIETLMSLGKTREEAIESLESSGKITPDTSALYVSSISDESLESVAEQILNAINNNDTETLQNLFSSENLSSSDWVKIINTYSDLYGSSLVLAIDNRYGDGDTNQTEFYTKIVNALTTEAENGNEEAYTAIALSIKGAADKNENTNYNTTVEFLKILFEIMNDKTISEVNKCYASVNGTDLLSDISRQYRYTYSYYAGFWETIFGIESYDTAYAKEGSAIIAQINRAIAAYS